MAKLSQTRSSWLKSIVILLVSCSPVSGYGKALSCAAVFAPQAPWISQADRWLNGSRNDNENFLSSLGPLETVDAANFKSLSQMTDHQVRSALEISAQEPLEISLPDTPARSGALVHVVRRRGEPIAVFKIFKTDAEASRDILADRFLRRLHLHSGRPPELYRIYEIKWAGQIRPALLMEYLPQTDLEALLHGKRENLNQAVVQAAMTLAELHSAAPDGQRAIDPEFKEYEIKKVREYLKPEAFKVFEQRGWLGQKEAAKLQAVIEDRIQKYSGITSIPGAFTHRDAHPGNIIKDFGDQSIHLIDNETLMWSMRKENGKVYGVGDPLADIGRFVAGLTLQARRGKMSDADISDVTNEFIESYEDKMNFDPTDLKTSLDFYFIRFAAVVLNQEHSNLANTPDMQRQMLDLLKQKFL